MNHGLELWEIKKSDPQAFSWINQDGHKSDGAISVKSTPPINPKKRYVYEAELSQCVKLDQGRRYRFAASFKAKGLYESRHANRVNLYWYQSEDCSTQGQFADYLEPDPDTQGWQRITKEGRLRSLNAKAALVTIIQSRTTSNNQQAFWDDIELTPTEMEAGTNARVAVNHKHTLPAGQNHIANGDFQSNLKSWRHSGDTQWVISEGANTPGAARLAIFSDRGGLGAHTFSQCVNIGANKVFRTSAKVKVDPLSTQQGGGIFRLSWYEQADCLGRNQAGFKEDRVENIEGWQELSITSIEAPPGAQSANVHITRGVDDSGLFAYFIDDVYFTAVTEGVQHVESSSNSTDDCAQLSAEGRELITAKAIRSCTRDEDCTTYTHCPLGCYRSINKKSEATLDAFISRFSKSCGYCSYECVAKGDVQGQISPEVKCIANLCQ